MDAMCIARTTESNLKATTRKVGEVGMRLIDADALMKYCNNLKGKTIDANDIARFPTVSGWISVKDGLPEETPSLFSRFKGTDKWSNAMWVMDSATVLVTVKSKGKSIVTTGKLQDGKWCTRISPLIDYTVTHWMPLPEPPKEDTDERIGRT